jgi:hypothetical protein
MNSSWIFTIYLPRKCNIPSKFHLGGSLCRSPVTTLTTLLQKTPGKSNRSEFLLAQLRSFNKNHLLTGAKLDSNPEPSVVGSTMCYSTSTPSIQDRHRTHETAPIPPTGYPIHRALDTLETNYTEILQTTSSALALIADKIS